MRESSSEAAANSPRRRGAPTQINRPEVRERYLSVAAAHLLGERTTRQLAITFRKSRRTICYWIAKALAFDDPRADVLRARLNAAALSIDERAER